MQMKSLGALAILLTQSLIDVSAFQSGAAFSLAQLKSESCRYSSSSAEAETQISLKSLPNPPDMQAYASGYSTVFNELPAASCKPTLGQIPADLIGTYFRSGPAMFSAGSLPPPKLSLVKPTAEPVPDGKDMSRMVKHPFEGDGAVLAVTFPGDNTATARFRYVRTAGFTSERKKGKKLYSGMDSTRENCGDAPTGNDVPLPFYKHHLQPGLNKNRKNTSNTRPVYWAKKLLTLWEGGLPYKLDSLALSTEGKSQLGGVLKPDTSFCSKGAYDSINDRMLFYENQQDSSSSKLTVYEFNSKFRLVAGGDEGKTYANLPGIAVLSDFTVTENYSIFIQPPINTNGLQYMISKEPGKTLSMDTNSNALLHLVPRVGGSKKNTEPKSFSIPLDGFPESDPQFVNAYEDENGDIIMDMIRSDGRAASRPSTTWPWSTDSLSDYSKTSSKKTVWRYKLNVSIGSIEKENLRDTQSYFGVINPAVSGQKHKYIYTNVGAMGSDIAPPQGIEKLDCDSNTLDTWFPEEYEFCGEPMFAPRRVESGIEIEEDDGYILSILYNGKKKESEMIVLSAKNISNGPVARVSLGMAVPHGYFGTFVGSEEADWSFEEIDRRAKLGDKMEAKGSMWNEVKSDFSGLGLRLDDFEEYFGDML